MLINSDWFWLILINAHWFWLMLIKFYLCWLIPIDWYQGILKILILLEYCIDRDLAYRTPLASKNIWTQCVMIASQFVVTASPPPEAGWTLDNCWTLHCMRKAARQSKQRVCGSSLYLACSLRWKLEHGTLGGFVFMQWEALETSSDQPTQLAS